MFFPRFLFKSCKGCGWRNKQIFIQATGFVLIARPWRDIAENKRMLTEQFMWTLILAFFYKSSPNIICKKISLWRRLPTEAVEASSSEILKNQPSLEQPAVMSSLWAKWIVFTEWTKLLENKQTKENPCINVLVWKKDVQKRRHKITERKLGFNDKGCRMQPWVLSLPSSHQLPVIWASSLTQIFSQATIIFWVPSYKKSYLLVALHICP